MKKIIDPNVLLIGQRVPSVKMKAMKSIIDFPEDYNGKWVVLFTLPKDFASSFARESKRFQNTLNDFRAMNTHLIGLCIDSIYNYINCLETYKKMEKNGMKTYDNFIPIVEDVELIIAKKFCMLQAKQPCHIPIDTFLVIDPNSRIRCILNYSISSRENFKEIKYIIQGLQNADEDIMVVCDDE